MLAINTFPFELDALNTRPGRKLEPPKGPTLWGGGSIQLKSLSLLTTIASDSNHGAITV